MANSINPFLSGSKATSGGIPTWIKALAKQGYTVTPRVGVSFNSAKPGNFIPYMGQEGQEGGYTLLHGSILQVIGLDIQVPVNSAEAIQAHSEGHLEVGAGSQGAEVSWLLAGLILEGYYSPTNGVGSLWDYLTTMVVSLD